MTKNIMKTFSATPKDVVRKWYVVDATDLILGRMSVVIADYLRGKRKVYFTPNIDCGDYVIVINAEKVALTGNKGIERFYWYTGYIGGIKFRTKKQLLEKTPERLIENSVKRMITRSPLGRDIMGKLFVYAGKDHPHSAQKPEVLDIKAMSSKNSKRS
jgi:large subunit ribosomal protein L13